MKLTFISILTGLFLFSCANPTDVASNNKEELVDEGKLDSIIISQGTTAPTKAIKALENRAYFLDSFPSKDSLIIYADIYLKNKQAPTILLCHQAGYSRGSYKEIAKTLNIYGYSVVALDQRSGKEVNGIENLSYNNALVKNKETTFLAAKQDIEAAIDYIYQYTQKPILLVGSSYSASLCLMIGKNNDKVKAIAAFSPGEYFERISVKDTLKGLNKPIFITSSKKENQGLDLLTSLVDVPLKTEFTPNGKGYHGAKALWTSNKGNEEYWNAFNQFLKAQFPAK